uniref:2,4-dienoyl-CoA reductase n=1 Tax=Caenorhabditis tropicalis TaxID=1561998 RepID=A0A1I7V117_9PELO
MDIRDPQMVTNAFDEINKKFGKDPEILVNNAAGNFIMATERLSPNAYGTIIDIVLKGTMNVTTELGRRCIQNKKGAAVTSITAGYARAGGPFVVPSSISKAGVENMTKSLATEWSKYGLRFNAVSPGPIPTKGAFGRLFSEEIPDAIEVIKQKNPEGRHGVPEEVANLVAFVSSDYMTFLNGVIIDLDGGQQHLNHGSHMGDFLHDFDQKTWEQTENVIRGRTGKEKK